ncbi:hypothetical protein HZC33_00730 [Candidatus Wolfebacteria bacterium]|nr:hypothetical protein [Candidatus Wolfebacteria bacterium]
MAYGNNGDFQRKMFQGNWKCSKCDADITELPFEPDPSRVGQLLCRECHKAGRSSFSGGSRGGRSFGNGGGERKMFQGNWECSQCNSPITELPFEPDPSRVGQLLCKECHRSKRGSFGGGRSFGRR